MEIIDSVRQLVLEIIMVVVTSFMIYCLALPFFNK